MTTTHQHLNDVHNQIRTDDKVMKEARHRRDRVLALAASFPACAPRTHAGRWQWVS